MRSTRYFLAPILSLCLAGPALAQMTQGTSTVGPSTGTQSGGGYAPATPVLPYPDLPRRDLRLTSVQVDRLKAALTQTEVGYLDQIDRLSRVSEAERVRLWRELERNMGNDWLRAASQVLTPAQLEHYARHAIEARGLESLSDAQILKTVGSLERLQQVQSLRNQAERELGLVPVLARENLREAARRHEEYRQRWYEATNTVLDGFQRRMWRDMDNGNFNFKPNIASPDRR